MATSPKAAKPGPKPASSSDSAPSTAAGSRKKLFIIGGAALLLAVGGGAWYVMGPGAQHKTNSAPAKAEIRPAAPPVFLALENFTVNLQSEEMQQFLQVAITLQVADNAQIELIKANMPQVRNRLLLLLSGKKATEILSVEGKKKLSAEIMEQLQQPFTPQGPRPEVSEVFFTSFVVQ